MKYSLPVLKYTTALWPYGRETTTAVFAVERAATGNMERVTRVTLNPKTNKWNKPKKTTYSVKARIVKGEDERTYVAELSIYGHITIRESNLQYEKETFYPKDEGYQDALSLFKERV